MGEAKGRMGAEKNECRCAGLEYGRIIAAKQEPPGMEHLCGRPCFVDIAENPALECFEEVLIKLACRHIE